MDKNEINLKLERMSDEEIKWLIQARKNIFIREDRDEGILLKISLIKRLQINMKSFFDN